MDPNSRILGARAPRLAALAALLAALSVAPRAAAATKPVAAPAKTPASVPAAPARAPVAAASRAHAPSPRAAPAGRVAWFGAGVGALSAFRTGRSIAGQLDYGVLRTPESWRRLDLELHVVASFARPAGTVGLTGTAAPPLGGPPVQLDTGREKVAALLFEVVPTARALLSPVQGVAFFADAGLGLVQTVESYDRTEMYVGRSSRSEYATGVVARLGAGLAVDATPRWRLVLEPLCFDLMLGPKFSAWTPSLGVAYRL